MVSNLHSFSVEFLPNPYIECPTIRLIGSFSCLFTICKISVNSSLKGCFDLINGIPFVGNNIIDKKNLTMQTIIFDACFNCAGITFVGNLAHEITFTCFSAYTHVMDRDICGLKSPLDKLPDSDDSSNDDDEI